MEVTIKIKRLPSSDSSPPTHSSVHRQSFKGQTSTAVIEGDKINRSLGSQGTNIRYNLAFTLGCHDGLEPKNVH